MSYLAFLVQWYNWPYVGALVLGVLSFTPLGPVSRLGDGLGRVLDVHKVAGRLLVRVFAVVVGVLGLTVNGALHDYFPASQERGFLPGLMFTLLVAALLTRSAGKLFERQFPEIKAVGWGATDLAGREGRVVSREVSPEYPAGRAQVMEEDGTLHMVMCKTRDDDLPYGALIILVEYDESDRRYFVERAKSKDATGEGVELHPDA
jgi:hypothetical protein